MILLSALPDGCTIAGAIPAIVEGGNGGIDGKWVGPEMHVGGWEAALQSREAKAPQPPIDLALARKYLAKVARGRVFISNFYEDAFDPFSVGQTAKVLRLARARGLEVGQFGFPTRRYGRSITQWQADNDAIFKPWKSSATLIIPCLYVPDAIAGESVLPLWFIYEVCSLLAESNRLGDGREEVVPAISDRSVSGKLAVNPPLLSQLADLLVSLYTRRALYWSDNFNPAAAEAVTSHLPET